MLPAESNYPKILGDPSLGKFYTKATTKSYQANDCI